MEKSGFMDSPGKILTQCCRNSAYWGNRGNLSTRVDPILDRHFVKAEEIANVGDGEETGARAKLLNKSFHER
jgi:hypothetical protein